MYKVKGKNGNESVQVYENGKTINKPYEDLFNEHIYQPKRELMFGCDVTDYSGKKYFTLEKEDMVSMSIEFDAVNGSKYQFGCLSCAKLNLEVKFSSVITKYSFLEPYIKLLVSYYVSARTKRSEWIKVPLGRFIAYDIKSQYLTRTIQAYDAAYAYEEDEITSFPHYNLILEEGQKCADPYFTFSTKCTLGDIITYINTSTDFAKIRRRQGIDQIRCTEKTPCTNLKECKHDKEYIYPIIDVGKLGLKDYLETIVYDLNPNMTLRTFIGYLAGLQGKNAMFNRDGELEFRNPKELARDFEYNGSHYGEYSEEDTSMKVRALQCSTVIGEDKTYKEETNEIDPETGEYIKLDVKKFEVSDVTYQKGVTSDMPLNDIHVFSNPIVKEAQLSYILDKVKQEYIPCSFKMKGDPRLDINSVIRLKRRRKTTQTDTSYEEDEILVPIMKMKMRLNNSCFLEIQAVADLEEKKATTLAGSMTQRVGTLGKELSETTSMAKGMFMELYGSQASFGDLFTEKAQLGTVVTNKITAAEAEFKNVIANDIKAGTGVIGTVISDKINASSASIKDLIADEIEAVNVTIKALDAEKVDTDYLFTENAEIENVKINTAFIKDLQADVITGGVLNLKQGITISSGEKTGKDNPNDDKEKFRESLEITANSIIMNSPLPDSNGDPTTGKNQERVFIGKRNGEYVFEIFDEYGTPLWGSHGVTAAALNSLSNVEEDGTVTGQVNGDIISSMHASKVYVANDILTSEIVPSDPDATHTTLYKYLRNLDTTQVKYLNTSNNPITLKKYLDDLSKTGSDNSGLINGNTGKINALDRRVKTNEEKIKTIEETTIPNLNKYFQGKIDAINNTAIPNIQDQIDTINKTTIPNLSNVVEGKASNNDLLILGTQLNDAISTNATNIQSLSNDFYSHNHDEYITESELDDKGYLTQHQDISYLATKEELSTYALKTEIPSLNDLILRPDMPINVDGNIITLETYINTKLDALIQTYHPGNQETPEEPIE